MLTFFQSYQKHFESYQKTFESYQKAFGSYQKSLQSYQIGLQCLRLEAHLAGFALVVVLAATSEPLQAATIRFFQLLDSRCSLGLWQAQTALPAARPEAADSSREDSRKPRVICPSRNAVCLNVPIRVRVGKKRQLSPPDMVCFFPKSCVCSRISCKRNCCRGV
jgi:hypothetical protein